MADSPQKRDAKPFEPPPWEREQFEELQRQREAGQAAEQPAEPQPESRPPESGGEESAAQPPSAAAEPPATSQEGGADSPGTAQAPTSRKLPPDSHIKTMLIQLGAEEPKLQREAWKVSAFAAVVLGILGTSLVMYGLVGALKTRGAGIAGAFGAGVVAIFGFLMVAGAIWSGFRSSQQKRGEI